MIDHKKKQPWFNLYASNQQQKNFPALEIAAFKGQLIMKCLFGVFKSSTRLTVRDSKAKRNLSKDM